MKNFIPNKEQLINKSLNIFVGKLKKVIEHYLFKSKLQRQIEDHEYLQKRLDKMSKQKLNRWQKWKQAKKK